MNRIRRAFALSDRGAKDLVRASLMSVLANLSLMLPVLLLASVLDRLLWGGVGGAGQVLVYTGLGLVILALIFITHYFQYTAAYIGTYRESTVRRVSLAETLRRLPLSFFGGRDTADLTAMLMGDCASFEHAFSHTVPQLVGSVISTSLVCVALIAYNWRMGLALFWVAPVAFGIILLSRRLQDRLGKRHLQARRDAADGVQEFLETAQELRACNGQARYLEGLEDKLDEAERAQIASELTTASLTTCGQIVLRLGLATVIVLGGRLAADGDIELMTYLLYLLAASRVYDPLSGALGGIAEVFTTRLQVDRLRQVAEHPVQTGRADYTLEGYDLVFDHVRFAYSGGRTVLEDVSFTARQGQVTALVGPSGGGKSTAIRLAARFWDVDGGRITLGGVNIRELDPEALLKSYAVVFQDVVIFQSTVMENIRMGRKEATDEEVYAAARAAQCHEFIRRLPQGYETEVGENGSTLSGGECQRISIARAILKDAPVVLLDEATASLDADSESQVQLALTALIQNRTVLIVAHRLRTVEGADRIVVLDGGRDVQQGRHDELVDQQGRYRDLYNLQFDGRNR